MFINLTPHVIHLPTCSIAPSGQLARCTEVTSPTGIFEGVTLVRRSYGAVTGLPDPQPDVLYIVSMLVRVACSERRDLASPGDLVRDNDGNIIGTSNLVVN
jgi:hypothetical protein